MSQPDQSVVQQELVGETKSPSRLNVDERRELVNRIASSPPFLKSPRLRQFLLFVTERSLTGHAEDLTEYEIGWKVFERGERFNPSEDSIVRTAARQLRTKLKEYFDSDTHNEKWLLEIPKGGYVPTFSRRDAEHESSNIRSDTASSATVSALRRWKIATAALVVFLICALSLAYLFSRRVPVLPEVVGRSVLSTVLTEGEQPTKVVVGDFGAALMAIARKQNFSPEEYANGFRPSLERFQSDSTRVHSIWPSLATGQVVSYPDMIVVGAILRATDAEGKKVVVQHARQLTARDLRTGNFVLLSAPIASPWMTLFEDKLNFKYSAWYESDKPGVRTEFRNHDPLPGEKLVYEAAATAPGFGVTYGLVARVPNLAGTGKVLLVFGLKYTGLEAAGEYATNPRSAAELARLFRVGDISQVPNFEVLLEAYSLDAAPRDVKVVAFRSID